MHTTLEYSQQKMFVAKYVVEGIQENARVTKTSMPPIKLSIWIPTMAKRTAFFPIVYKNTRKISFDYNMTVKKRILENQSFSFIDKLRFLSTDWTCETHWDGSTSAVQSNVNWLWKTMNEYLNNVTVISIIITNIYSLDVSTVQCQIYCKC